MQHLKEIVLPNYPLILSLLKHRGVWGILELKNEESKQGKSLK